MKKYIGAAAALLMLCAAASAAEPTAKETAKAKVEELCKATKDGDFAKVADLTHPDLIKMMGGREKMIRGIAATMADLRSQGFAVTSFKVGDPADPVPAGTELYIIVPTESAMKIPDGKMQLKGFVVGCSNDKGKTWVFLDGNVGRPMIEEMMPNMPKELEFPKKEQPVIEKDAAK